MITTRNTSKKSALSDDDDRIHLSDEKEGALDTAIVAIREKQKERLTEIDAQSKGQHYVNLQQFPISNLALPLLDRALCEREQIICFFYQDEQMRLGAIDPDAESVRKEAAQLEEKHRAEVRVYRISQDSLSHALKRYDALPKVIEQHDEGLELTEETLKKQQEKFTSLQDLGTTLAKAPVTETLSLIIGAALKAGASDIHIEAEADDINVRLRIDGVLHTIGLLPKESWGRIISRIKLVAGLKINVFTEPQDGRFTIHIDNDRVEVRTSVVPTSYGESVVMRLLKFSIDALKFDALGLTGYTLSVMEREVGKPNGMIVSTGPTGSGKTTTLYAILHTLNAPDTKILTLEDPVEYKLKGINQTQVDAAKGLDFAKGLRSMLRQDPDIIMVGEIRDLETAETAINAALTGHLMLSTLHTNSAAGAIPRLLAMGAKNFLLAPSINALIGQRLVRRLCEKCKTKDSPDEATMKRVRDSLAPIIDRTDLGVAIDLKKPENFTFLTAPGCDQCSHLGYRGRIGIFEILTMSKDLEKIILSGKVSEYEIKETAVASGMITMFQDGILKALAGITSLQEVFRVVE